MNVLRTAGVSARIIKVDFLAKLRTFSVVASQDYIKNVLSEIVELREEYGFHDRRFDSKASKTIIVEYSSPNIAKRFHAGHFRSTVVGHAISNILEAAGNEVIRLNYLGDWGLQFAILFVGFEKYGSQELLEKTPLRHLFEVYVKAMKDVESSSALKQHAQDIFLRMENGDENLLRFWQTCRSASLAEFEELYKNIGVRFDDYESESMYRDESKNILSSLRKMNLLVSFENDTEGVDISHSSRCKMQKSPVPPHVPMATLSRSNGTSLYLTRDVAAAISRKKRYNFDKMYYITDQSQEFHFLQLFGVLELMGKDWARPEADTLHHKTFGRVQGMRTRQGEVVFLEDILNEAYNLVKTERLQHSTRKQDISDVDSLIRILGLSGLICNDLKSKLQKDYKFRWDIALQSKGFTGIFLQYTHSRLQSLQRLCGVELNYDVDCVGLTGEKTALELVTFLKSYTDVAWKSYTELEPCNITQYMFQLSHLVAQALKHLPVKGQDLSVAQPRLLLFHCAQIVLHNCMKTIGMTPLDKM